VKRFAIAAALILTVTVAVPAMAKTHYEEYNISCSTLWQGVRDTVRNSGKYGIIGIDSTEMTASFNIGGNLTGKRINSVVLNPKGAGCEMQIQTAFSGLVNDDAGRQVPRLRHRHSNNSTHQSLIDGWPTSRL